MVEIHNNSGVAIGGNNIGAAAAGQNAKAIQNVDAPTNIELSVVLERLQQTRSWIEAHRSEVDQPDLALWEISRLRNLLRAEEPDPGGIRASVGRLAQQLNMAAGIVGGVQSLHELIEQFLG